MSKKTPEGTVHLYPTPGHFIPGVPAIEQDVDAERAAELLAYQPPAFTTDPAEAADGPVALYVPQPQTGEAEAAPTDEPPAEPASSPDSKPQE